MVRHEGGTGWTWVDAVFCPMLRSGVLSGRFEYGMKRNKAGVERFGNPFSRGTILVELREPLVINRAAPENERFADDEFNFGKNLFRAFQKRAVIAIINFDGAFVIAVERVPYVVDPNQDA